MHAFGGVPSEPHQASLIPGRFASPESECFDVLRDLSWRAYDHTQAPEHDGLCNRDLAKCFFAVSVIINGHMSRAISGSDSIVHVVFQTHATGLHMRVVLGFVCRSSAFVRPRSCCNKQP